MTRRKRKRRREPITRAAPDTDSNVAPEASITLCRPFFRGGGGGGTSSCESVRAGSRAFQMTPSVRNKMQIICTWCHACFQRKAAQNNN